MSAPTDVTRDHWWWRPGWRQGRSFYTWHLTFADQPDVRRLTSDYAAAISPFPTLDPVGPAGLHLTIQGLGFTDEIDAADVQQIIEASRPHCARVSPFTLTVGPAHVDLETVQMYVQPPEPVVQLRLALRQGIADVWGSDHIPESMDGFRPHVTLAYSNGATLLANIATAVETVGPVTAQAEIAAVSLIQLNRDQQRYEWSEVATIRLG